MATWKVALMLAVQSALVALAVVPQLSARLTGDEIALRVEAVDPIDPFRGAYVTLNYPDLRHDTSSSAAGGHGAMEDGESGTVYVGLAERDGVWAAESFSRERPEDGTYLACDDRDWQIRCGIETWFLPQEQALAMEEDLADGGMIARVRVDPRGHAALVGVEPR